MLNRSVNTPGVASTADSRSLAVKKSTRESKLPKVTSNRESRHLAAESTMEYHISMFKKALGDKSTAESKIFVFCNADES